MTGSTINAGINSGFDDFLRLNLNGKDGKLQKIRQLFPDNPGRKVNVELRSDGSPDNKLHDQAIKGGEALAKMFHDPRLRPLCSILLPHLGKLILSCKYEPDIERAVWLAPGEIWIFKSGPAWPVEISRLSALAAGRFVFDTKLAVDAKYLSRYDLAMKEVWHANLLCGSADNREHFAESFGISLVPFGINGNHAGENSKENEKQILAGKTLALIEDSYRIRASK